jgi:hypothetical protein
MKKFKNYKLTKYQQKLILGGKAQDITVDCGGGVSITCSGSECTDSDGTKSCQCTTPIGTDIKSCPIG